MTILSAQSIKFLQPVSPFHEREEQDGLSFGLGPASYDIRLKWGVDLPPYSFNLGVSLEHINLPDNVLGWIADKSSWARRGIAAFNTIIDPGFRGHLTLELTNHSDKHWYLIGEIPIVQIVFMWIDKATDRPYCGKYQDQPDHPVKALGGVDPEDHPKLL